jgi:hypothetical protein
MRKKPDTKSNKKTLKTETLIDNHNFIINETLILKKPAK